MIDDHNGFDPDDYGDDLFVPLTPANPAAPKPKCRRHTRLKVHFCTDPAGLERGLWHVDQKHLLDPVLPCEPGIICTTCWKRLDPAASRRGKNNRQRGNAIERELGKKLGMKRVGQFGGKDDLSNALFAAQVKSGGYFSERQWAWLKAIPVKAGQTQLLVIADTPGPGRKRRALVILDLDDWRELHGQIGADEP